MCIEVVVRPALSTSSERAGLRGQGDWVQPLSASFSPLWSKAPPKVKVRCRQQSSVSLCGHPDPQNGEKGKRQ